MSERFQRYLDYIKNTGGNPTISQFDEDWEPVGPIARADMKAKELIYELNGRVYEMTTEDLNKWLHENVMKECWHGPSLPEEPQSYACRCGLRHCTEVNPDYLHDPAAYWRLLQKVKEHERWDEFVDYSGTDHAMWNAPSDVLSILLEKEDGCQAIREFNWEG